MNLYKIILKGIKIMDKSKMTLKEYCEYYRHIKDDKLDNTQPILMMLDGRGFSSGHPSVKSEFKLPYDSDFRSIMDRVAKDLVTYFKGEVGYTQSDEISIYINPKNLEFDGRLVKYLSEPAAYAAARFQIYYLEYKLNELFHHSGGKRIFFADYRKYLESLPTREFDCKVWNVPTLDDVAAWFLYRQVDCTRNSKQVAAQSVFTQAELMNLTADEMVEKMKKKKEIDWDDYSDRDKYGSYCYRELTKVEIPENKRQWKVNKNKDFVYRRVVKTFPAKEKLIENKEVLKAIGFTDIPVISNTNIDDMNY